MEIVTLQTTFLLTKTMLFTEPLLGTRYWTKYFFITSKVYFNSTRGTDHVYFLAEVLRLRKEK